MEQWITNVGTWVLSIVALAVGFFLLVRALLDVRSGLGADNKDWGKVAIGVVVGLVGGFIGYWGANNIINFFKTNGQQIPRM
ncbi:hypothetical protein AAK913_12065 [Enterococcus faecium]|jgi:hypothetical protein|uniref:hypothetical protein n=1 Tax=Enterococcus faecium TaxID=1352 RepID=UPI001F3EF287|nr:hypothetical protein [Enterococcus faecium]EKZ0201717.1 hypothetical protein [Enterococcus faecalis]MCF8636734.1 hypothetical protein [Enterococcus faecium]HAQ5747081.1 hypothetical protein [Enterococcus faecium]